ncbi:hypothetical protein SAMN04487950_1469 [Halogranum rubrum]|uniref:Uncharacterized protein n=1 Tax=Halogranum rubrum TaxID=553466 RepID=A0A1I4CZX6_9EURY|nr:hypothetical protein [Halogranum rubrum]SFK85767.1 hypothetical protein SAMN04487950_1469 [Halogranum rubrum]
MPGKHFTLLEVHLGDGHIQIGPKTIRGGVHDHDGHHGKHGKHGKHKHHGHDEHEHYDHDHGDEEHADDENESSGTGLLPFVLGLVVLGGIAFLASKFRSRGEMNELAELDESAAEA